MKYLLLSILLLSYPALADTIKINANATFFPSISIQADSTDLPESSYTIENGNIIIH